MIHEPSWIGFYAEKDDDWKWSDGTDVGYQRWEDGRKFPSLHTWKKNNLKHKIIFFSLNDASVSEPDNQGNSKDCVMISGENGTWSDYAWYLSSFYKVK